MQRETKTCIFLHCNNKIYIINVLSISKLCIFFFIQTVGFPTRKDGFIFLLLKNKVKTTNIVTFSFINPFEKNNHYVFSTFQRWANVDPTLPHKLKSWGKHASKYIRWANVGAMLAHKTFFFSEIYQICMTLDQRWCNVVHLIPTVSQLSDQIWTIFQRWANVVMLSGVMLGYFYCMPLKYIYIHMIFWPLRQFWSSVNETNVFMYVVTVWFVFLWLQTLYDVLCWIKLFVLYCIYFYYY